MVDQVNEMLQPAHTQKNKKKCLPLVLDWFDYGENSGEGQNLNVGVSS